MDWYRVTLKASSLRYTSSAIIRLNIRAISPTDAVNRIGNRSIQIPGVSVAFETWSVKATYKLKDQRNATFIPVTQMNQDGSTPTTIIRSWEWI